MTTAKYWLFLLFLAISLSSFINKEREDVEMIRKNVIRLVINRIKKEHYAPKAIDDDFSRAIWKKYLLVLDGNKNLFLKTDIENLRKYETTIDDELQAPSLEFFNTIFALSMQRLNEVTVLYKNILSKPLDFSGHETVAASRGNADFPANEAERKEVWRKSIMHSVLQKMIEIQTADNKKSDAVAEKEAREKIEIWMDGMFKNLLANNAADERFSAYVNTVTFEMDPHTSYFAPADARTRDAMMAHRYYGLGLELISKEGDIIIKRVLPGGTADISGLLHANDNLLQLSDGSGKMVSVSGMSIVDVSKMIRGEKETTLKLLVRKATGVEKEVTVARGEVIEDENAAKSAVIDEENKKIGYISLKEFYRDFKRIDGAQCAADVAREVLKLKAEDVSGIILDLRGNPGGSLDEVVKMIGFFIKSGPAVLAKSSEKTERYDIENGDQTLYDGPLTVMVDEGSASASEIFAAAIQDYKRGIIVGSPSYGKGTMQMAIPMGKLGDKSKGIPDISYGTLTLTIKKFYRVNGTTTQLKGVTPDVIFPGKMEYLKIKEIDNGTALSCDTIESAYFINSPAAKTLPAIIAAEKGKVSHDRTFDHIQQDVKWLKENEDQPLSLNVKTFKKQLYEVQSRNNSLDAALKLPADKQLKMHGTARENQAPDKITRYQEWIKILSADVYLAQTAAIINDMMNK
ncbi:S41A family C-terminal processing peptidase-1 [Chitinophaga niastensis]|uniref:S41A family C-terminal processing peptidase-1 n=1 Tax=Chitinophaga niastensis TaxID=536980 RepID=A0A2P8HK07_CHINA|nr:carboxy terminal-processing peptidase [Chitinophaga niastensis]PSL46548.1 S41A family C-terminal processing peptidase-1 [Chitinophaga niastensis]